MKRRIIAITHGDLDGITCAILLKDYAKKNGHEFEYYACTYKDVDEIFSKCLNHEDLIFITDISIVDEDKIPLLSSYSNVTIIDHHPRTYLSSIANQYLAVDRGAGCKMVYDTMTGLKHKYSKGLRRLMILADDFDLWLHKHPMSMQLNRLFFYYGAADFIKRFADGLDGFTKKEYLFFKEIEKEIKVHIDSLEIVEVAADVAFTYSALHIAEVAEHMKIDLGYKYAIVYNRRFGYMSFRADEKDDSIVDLGKFLDTQGGGGHKAAAGIRVDGDDMVMDVVAKFVEYKMEEEGVDGDDK